MLKIHTNMLFCNKFLYKSYTVRIKRIHFIGAIACYWQSLMKMNITMQ